MGVIEHSYDRTRMDSTKIVPNGTVIFINWLHGRGENIIAIVVDCIRTHDALKYVVIIDNGELRTIGWVYVAKWYSWSEDE
jgi:hypothetical protein